MRFVAGLSLVVAMFAALGASPSAAAEAPAFGDMQVGPEAAGPSQSCDLGAVQQPRFSGITPHYWPKQYLQQTVAWQVTFDESTVAAWQAYGGYWVFPYAVYRSTEPAGFSYDGTGASVRSDGLLIPDPPEIGAPTASGGSIGTKTKSATYGVDPGQLAPPPGMPPYPFPPQDSHLIGFGYIMEPDSDVLSGKWVALPQDTADHVGQIGLTNPAVCEWYWGEKIAQTDDGTDNPMGPLGPAVPESQTWGCPCAMFHDSRVDGSQGWANGSNVDRSAADPVHTADGSQFESAQDLAVPSPGIDFDFARFYNGADPTGGPLGVGWTDEYNASLSIDGSTGDVTFRDPTGAQGKFLAQPDGSYDGDVGVLGTLTSLSGGGWKLNNSARRETLWFDADGHETKDVNGDGQGQTIAWTGSGSSAHITTVIDAVGRTVTFSYGSSGPENGKLTQIATADGRTVHFAYSTIAGTAHLTSVTAADGKITTLTYDSDTGKLNSISAPDPGHVSVQDTFDSSTGRVKTQTDADGNIWHFDWDADTTGPTGTGTETITDPRGNVSTDQYYGNLLIQHIDADADTTEYSYDPNGDLTSVTDPNGHTTTMTYDANGRMLTRTNAVGDTETWTYDADGNQLSHTSYRGKTTSHTYTSGDLLASTTDPRGHTTSYTYNALGLVATKTIPRDATTNEVTHYAYDGDGNPTTVTTPSGAVTSYSYFPTGQVKSITDPDGNISGAPLAQQEAHTTHYTYYDNGLLHTTTDPNDNVTTDTYDGEGNLIEEKVADPSGTTASDTVYGYDPNGNLKTTTVNGTLRQTNDYDPAGNLHWTKDGDGDQTTFGYDAANHLTSKVVPNGNAAGATPADWTWTYGYDQNGNRTSVKAPGASAATVTSYDALNRVHTVTTPGGSVTTTDYYPDGLVKQVTDPDSEVTNYTYDDNGNLTATTSPRNKTATSTYTWDNLQSSHTTYNGTSTSHRTYDPDGHLKTSQDPDGNTTIYDRYPDGQVKTVTRADTTTLSYTYDGNGNTIGYTNGATKTTHYGYNALDQQISVTDPLTRTTHYTYDPAGTTTKVTRPDSSTTTYTVDPAERVTRINYSDPATPDVTFDYDADGNRTTMTDGTGTTTYGHDHRDRLTSTTTGSGSQVAYTYDADSEVHQITYPNGKVVTRGYDSAHHLTSVQDWLGNTTTFGYNNDAALTSEAYPNGITASIGVNDDDAVTSISDANGGSTIASFAYGRDPNQQMTSEHDTGTGQPDQSYTYTKLNQLRTINASNLSYTTADDPKTLASGGSTTYDDADQATTYTDPAGVPTTFRYDDNGNRLDGLTPDGTRASYGYDGANRLVSATTPATDDTGSGYHPVTLTRLVDTQTGTGSCSPSPCGTLPAAGTVTIQVAGNAGIPTSGVKAVVLTVTTLHNTSNGYLAAYPTGTTRPDGRSLSITSGQTKSAAVVTAISTDGKVTLYSSVSTDLLVDVSGWYAPGDQTGADFEPINGNRILDTRNGTGTCTPAPCDRLAAGSITTVQVNGEGGVPTDGVSAVAFTLTAFTPSATGHATAWNADQSQPGFRNLSYQASTNSSELVVAVPSAQGKIKIYTSAAADFTLDLAGYYTTSPGNDASIFVPYDETTGVNQRILDTRSGVGECVPTGCSKIDPATPVTVTIAGRGPVPADATAVLVSATAWTPDGDGGLVFWPADQARPPGRNLSYAAGTTTTGAVQVPLSAAGKININALLKATDLTLDVEGWFEPAFQTTDYTYDGNSLRATATGHGTTHTYTYDTNPTSSGDTPLLLTEQAGTTTNYLYGPDGVPFEQITTSGTTDTPAYLHTDQYGSVRATTNAAGTVIGTTTYTPSGVTSLHTGESTALGWASQYQDQDTGLYYLRARYYDPTTTQFTTRDPLETTTKTPYTYADNDPLNESDPTGKNLEPGSDPPIIGEAGPGDSVTVDTDPGGDCSGAAADEGSGGFTSLTRASPAGRSASDFEHGYDPADFPGGPGSEYPDGRAYFGVNDSSIAQEYAQLASYDPNLIETRIPNDIFEQEFKMHVSSYDGGPRRQIGVPRDLIPRLNEFPRFWLGGE